MRTEREIINMIIKQAGTRFAEEPYKLRQYLASEEFLTDIITSAPSLKAVPITYKRWANRIASKTAEAWLQSLEEAEAYQPSDDAEKLALAKIRQFYKGYVNPVDPIDEQLSYFKEMLGA